MKSNQNILSGRMFPDFSHPAPAAGAAGIANGAGLSPEQMTRVAQFADVLTSRDEFYKIIEGQISGRSFPRLGRSGTMVRGGFWTLNTSEWPNAAEDCSVCSLIEILETWEDWGARHPGATYREWLNYIKKFYLSANACRGIVRRAEKRGKNLLPYLQQALEAQMDME